jgi:hypothetical protein
MDNCPIAISLPFLDRGIHCVSTVGCDVLVVRELCFGRLVDVAKEGAVSTG